MTLPIAVVRILAILVLSANTSKWRKKWKIHHQNYQACLFDKKTHGYTEWDKIIGE